MMYHKLLSIEEMLQGQTQQKQWKPSAELEVRHI
jgi:hypothetical protein